MNKLKITLFVMVLTAIVAGIYCWIDKIKIPEDPKPPTNQFTQRIEDSIEALKTKPINEFCAPYYNQVTSDINMFSKPLAKTHPFGRFGNSPLENDTWEKNLLKNLYSAYTDKFIQQTKFVFSNPVWNATDLAFIQSEVTKLKSSSFLVHGSRDYNEFVSIQAALNKYKVIASFIWSCKAYSYSKTGLSDRFPIADVHGKIKYAAGLRGAGLENEYVNNCIKLHNDLKDIPQTLFNKHVKYLDGKINYWSDKHSHYSSTLDYNENLHNHIRAEIKEMDNNIYKVSIFNNEYQKLLTKWTADYSKAYVFKYPNP